MSMEDLSTAVIASAGGGALARPALQAGEDPGLTREASMALQIAGLRSNLLLEGPAGTIRTALEKLWPEANEPILLWTPGQTADPATPARAATLILHDVGELTVDDQFRVLRWLDQTAGVRVISTTAVPLWPRVSAGTFSEALYYRLNIVYLDLGRHVSASFKASS
jgi:hypothetical protein